MSDTPISGFEPCAHSTPQASSCLHGICVFCYRDRLGTALNERNAANEAIVDCHREYDILWDELIQLREERDRLREALEPFALVADEVGFRSNVIAPKDTWLWKPSSSKRDTAGINYQHILDARALCAPTLPTEASIAADVEGMVGSGPEEGL